LRLRIARRFSAESTKQWRVVLSAAIGVSLMVALSLPAFAASASADVRSSIVSITESQDQNGSAVANNPATTADAGCNPYTTYWGDGSGCSNGLRAEAWCADFAAWAWRQAGVNFTYGSGASDINAWSASFYFWGQATGNWHPLSSGYSPQPGDAAVYGNLTEASGPGHVGIYVGGSATSPTVVNGNWAVNWPNPTNYGVIGQSGESNTGVAGGDLDGYVSPGTTSGPPVDGSFVSYQGNVYRIAGGAPLYVSNWAAVGGAQPTEPLSAVQWSALNPVPANGTLISSTATGMVYEIAGGAPLYVSSFAAIGGPRAVVGVDQWDLDNITNAAAHMNAVPADGTWIGAGAGGQFGGDVFVVAGGAPLYVSNWAAIGGARPVVRIDEWDVENIANPAAHLNPVPANGTFISTSTGQVYRIAGGAPFAVSSWLAFGGQQPYVMMDEWDIDKITNPAAHLNARPLDGTLVEGLPFDGYWSFNGGLRSPATAASGAVTVDDAGLAAFPQSSCPAGQTGTPPNCKRPTSHPECVVPNLTRMGVGQAKSALSRAHCRLGKVDRPKQVARHHVLRVANQSTTRGSTHPNGYYVGITLK
jgi:hypothetical protein